MFALFFTVGLHFSVITYIKLDFFCISQNFNYEICKRSYTRKGCMHITIICMGVGTDSEIVVYCFGCSSAFTVKKQCKFLLIIINCFLDAWIDVYVLHNVLI